MAWLAPRLYNHGPATKTRHLIAGPRAWQERIRHPRHKVRPRENPRPRDWLWCQP